MERQTVNSISKQTAVKRTSSLPSSSVIVAHVKMTESFLSSSSSEDQTAVLDVVSESMETDPAGLAHSLPMGACGVCATWVSGVGRDAETKHALMWHRLTLLRPHRDWRCGSTASGHAGDRQLWSQGALTYQGPPSLARADWKIF